MQNIRLLPLCPPGETTAFILISSSMKKKIYIYDIYFPTSGKHYIGQTDNLMRRMSAHVKADSLVGRALYKYDDWKIRVLHTVRSRDVANTLEIEEIRNFDSVSPNGYNLTHGGEGGIPSEETKKKLSDAHKGENNPMYGADHSGENNPFYGKNHTEETLKKLSDAKTGENHPLYGKTGENNPRYGQHHSEKTIKKLSDAQTGKTDTQKLIIRYKHVRTRIKNLEQSIAKDAN